MIKHCVVKSFNFQHRDVFVKDLLNSPRTVRGGAKGRWSELGDVNDVHGHRGRFGRSYQHVVL